MKKITYYYYQNLGGFVMGRKKITALLLATALGISTAPINAWADSYTDVEAAAVTKAIENFCTNYATNLSDISNHVKSSSELQLMLGDGGQEILNSFSPVDVSWLNDVTIGIGTGMEKNNLTQSLDLRVNGTKICTLNYYIDFDSSKIYLNIPELHDGYIQMDLTNVYDGTEESGTDGLHIQMELADAVNNYFSILENLPEANSLQNVLTRYSKIILDNIEDQGSTSETVSAGAVQQDLTVSEGHITQKSAKSLLQAVLSTAKTDSELESIVENWTAIMNNPDYTYDAFVDSIAELEGALVDDDTDAAGLTLRAWTDDAGNVVGQQLLWKDGNIEQNFIKYLKTSAGTESGYLLKLAGDEDGILLEGSGKIADDLLNGTYTLTMDGSEIAIIDVADYDTAAIKDGVWNGTYIISGSAYETEDGEETDTLNKMQLIFGSDGMDNKNLSVRCSLVNNGAYLGTLFFTSDMENGIESVDPASLNDVYDFNDPDQAAAYTESINLDAIEAGLTDAGMPEGWLDSIISSFSSLEEDISSEAPEDELIKLEPAA
jgi:hypothetical protein